MIGIYKVTNPKGKSYIGQSINIEKRWRTYEKAHPNELKEQRKLLNSLKKYGPENHTFEIFEICIKIKNSRQKNLLTLLCAVLYIICFLCGKTSNT